MCVCRMLCVFCGLWGAASGVGAADQPDDGEIVMVLSSADRLMEDVKGIVVDLAGDQKGWEDSVRDNIEIWLFGVDRKLPVGLEVIFDADAGRRLQINVPVENQKEFREDNLNGTNITTKPVRGKPGLYELGGVQTGFMRMVTRAGEPTYASFSKVEAELPPDMSSPKAKYDEILKPQYDAALQWRASAGTAEKREKAFAKLQENLLEAIKKRPSESAAAYELRRLTVEQQSDRLSRIFTDCAELHAGWITDVAGKKFEGESRLVGLPDTALAKNIAGIGTEKSRFARIAAPEGAVLTARVLSPINNRYRDEQTHFFEVWLTAWNERIDEQADASAEEKSARKELAQRVVKMLTDGMSLGWIDTYADLAPAEGTLFTGVIAVRVQDSAEVLPILELLPRINSAWKVQLNTGEEQSVAIHTLDLSGKLPKTLKDFFGENGQLLVGTGDQTLWIAAGPNAENQLHGAIAASRAADGPEAAADPIHVTLRMHPILKLVHEFLQDRDIELVRSLNQSPLLKNGNEGAGTKRDDSERRVSRDALKNFKWQEAAIESLAAGNDGVELLVTKQEDALVGRLTLEEGVLRAVGKIISKFTAEILK